MQPGPLATNADETKAIYLGLSIPELYPLYDKLDTRYWLWPCVYCERPTSKLAHRAGWRSSTAFVCAGCLFLKREYKLVRLRSRNV